MNGVIEIALNVDKDTPVSLKIYYIDGRLVKDFTFSSDGISSNYFVCWDGRDNQNRILPCGIYFVVAEAGEKYVSKKLLLVK
ncbi:MAG: hypothetical protein N3A65_07080 [candidate division WOR-3 bacterium]|nr:hypothetical protein [candidate division WOR-3 bacterium]